MATRSLSHFIEQELGKLPHFLIYAVLECALIAILYLNRIITYLSNVFANLFELEPPCLLCTWVNPLFDQTDHDLYYNTTLCEGHKKEISSLAYCHVHRTLSDLRTMCDGCLLAFSSENNSIASSSTNGNNNNKDIENMFNDELRARLKMPGLVKDDPSTMTSGPDKANADFCSCCGEPMKAKSSSYQKLSVDLPQIKQVELKHPKVIPNISSDDEGGNLSNQVKEDARPAPISVPSLEESEDPTEDVMRTPSSARGGSKLLNMFIADSTTSSPRFALRTPRKSMCDRLELPTTDPFENVGINEPDDSIVNRLKRQMRLDRKSLVALYKELEEERSASAVAANNAMAMITRLQADKASVQMEALQYQRMMDEQAEYDQEALSALHELLEKREYEMCDMQEELELYRERYGVLRDVVKRSDNFDRTQSFESFTDKSDHEECGNDGHVSPDESVFDLETDVDHDPSISYYDHAYALYENEKLQGEGGDGDEENEGEMNRLEMVEQVPELENDIDEKANDKENDGDGRKHLEMVEQVPELDAEDVTEDGIDQSND